MCTLRQRFQVDARDASSRHAKLRHSFAYWYSKPYFCILIVQHTHTLFASSHCLGQIIDSETVHYGRGRDFIGSKVMGVQHSLEGYTLVQRENWL